MISGFFYFGILFALFAKFEMPSQHSVSGGVNQSHLAKGNRMPQLPNELRSVALQFLNNNENSWWVRDVTSSYGKIDVKRLFWIIDSEDKSITVAQSENGDAHALTGTAGLPLSSRLLEKSYGAKPWEALGVEKFAKNVMSWHSDPRSYVLTEGFFRKQLPVIKSWLTKREKNPEALKNECREPALAVDSTRWRLEFNAINRRGGVEHWTIRGQLEGFNIDQVTVAVVHDDGTFNFPDEL